MRFGLVQYDKHLGIFDVQVRDTLQQLFECEFHLDASKYPLRICKLPGKCGTAEEIVEGARRQIKAGQFHLVKT